MFTTGIDHALDSGFHHSQHPAPVSNVPDQHHRKSIHQHQQELVREVRIARRALETIVFERNNHEDESDPLAAASLNRLYLEANIQLATAEREYRILQTEIDEIRGIEEMLERQDVAEQARLVSWAMISQLDQTRYRDVCVELKDTRGELTQANALVDKSIEYIAVLERRLYGQLLEVTRLNDVLVARDMAAEERMLQTEAYVQELKNELAGVRVMRGLSQGAGYNITLLNSRQA